MVQHREATNVLMYVYDKRKSKGENVNFGFPATISALIFVDLVHRGPCENGSAALEALSWIEDVYVRFQLAAKVSR